MSFYLVKDISLAAAGSAGCSYELHGICIGSDNTVSAITDNTISIVIEGIKTTLVDGSKRLIRVNSNGITSGSGEITILNSGETTYPYVVSFFICNKDGSNPSTFSIMVDEAAPPA
jgi:hypothetical protein